MIDGGAYVDLDAVLESARDAEVVCIYFPALERTLLVDTRTAPGVPTFVAIVPIGRGLADRVRSLGTLRPQFPQPQSLTMIPWMRRVGSLVSCGVWPQLLARLDALEDASACLHALHALEMSQIRDAITGHEYDTLWTRADPTAEPPTYPRG